MKKQLEKAQQDLAKSKADSESRIDGVKAENTLVDALSLSSSFSEQNSIDGKNEIMRLLQQKSRELDEAQAKLTRKRAAIKELKRLSQEKEAKNQKLQAKLVQMGVFTKGMVKSIQSHHNALKEQVIRDQNELMTEFQATTTQILSAVKKDHFKTDHKKVQDNQNAFVSSLQDKNRALNEELRSLESQYNQILAQLDVALRNFDQLGEKNASVVSDLNQQIEALRKVEVDLEAKLLISDRVGNSERLKAQEVQHSYTALMQQFDMLTTQHQALKQNLSQMTQLAQNKRVQERPLAMSGTIQISVVNSKVEQSAAPAQILRADRLERASRCSSESNRSHRSSQMLQLPEEQTNSDEMEVKGEAIDKQLSPRREFIPDLAPRPLNLTPRPAGQPVRQVRPMQPVRPVRMPAKDEDTKDMQTSRQPSSTRQRPSGQPKMAVKMHADPFGQQAEITEDNKTSENQMPIAQQIPIVETKPEEKLEEAPKPIETLKVTQPEPQVQTKTVAKVELVQPISQIKAEPKPQPKNESEEKKVQKTTKDPEPEQAGSEGRFSSMINGLLSYLGRKKKTQAFLGQSANKMRFCEIKGRYVFEGESSSEDEPIPEPPKAKMASEKAEVKEEAKELTGTAALTQVAFGGALSGRGRGRGARGRPAQQERFTAPLKTENVAQISQATMIEKQKSEDHQDIIKEVDQTVNETFMTSLDRTVLDANNKTLNMTMYTANDKSSVMNDSVVELAAKQRLLEQLHDQIEYSENTWARKYAALQDKNKQLSKQVGLAQTELSNEKQQMQMTIEGMEAFISELKVEGENFQNEITALKQKLALQTDTLASTEVKLMQLADENVLQGQDLHDLLQKFDRASQDLAHSQMEIEMLKLTHEMEQLQTSQEIQPDLVELQIQRETDLWHKQLLVVDNARLTDENALLIQRNEQVRAELDQMRAQRERLLEEHKSSEGMVSVSSEHMKAAERERENLRELVQKLSQEKDRLQDQVKERERERENELKKLQNERKDQQRNFQKSLAEKDNQWEEKFSRLESQRQDQLRRLEDQLKQQAAELQKQEVKRTVENKRTEKQIKSQLVSLEGILNKKEEDLTNLQGYNQEVTQELQQMAQMREKLHDHIIYLQNEIRKRDELLEEGSELVDVDLDSDSFMEDDSMKNCLSHYNIEDDINLPSQASSHKGSPLPSKPKKRTLGQVLKNQLEESRNQLKSQVEQKLRAEVRCRAVESKCEKLNEGLGDILQILKQNSSRFDSEAQSASSDERSFDMSREGGEQMVQQIIAKTFTLLRSFDSQTLDLKHQLEKARLQIDDTDSIKFDLEIALDEKLILESELDQLRIEIQSSRKKYDQESKDRDQKQLAQVHAQYKAQIQEAAIKAQADLQLAKDHHQQTYEEFERQLQEARDLYQQERTQSEAHQAKFNDLAIRQELVTAQMETLQVQYQMQQRRKLEVEQSLEQKLHDIQELEATRAEEADIAQRENSDLLRELNSVKQRASQDRKSAQDELSRLEDEIQVKDATISKMQSEMEQIVAQFIEKKDAYKGQVARLKTELKTAVSALRELDEQHTSQVEQIQDLQSQLYEKSRQENNADRFAELEENLVHAKSEAQQWKDKFEAAENDNFKAIDEKDAQLRQSEQQLNQARVEAHQSKEQATNQFQLLQQQLNSQSEVESNLRKQLQKLQDDINYTSQGFSQSQVDEIVEQVQQQAALAIEKLKKKQHDASAKFKQAFADLTDENQSLMQEVDTLKKSNQTLQASSADHESKIDLLRDQLNVERETELKMLQESAQQTINALQKKRDAKEAKLKEALNELSEELEEKSQENHSLKEIIIELRSKVQGDLNDTKNDESVLKAFDKSNELEQAISERNQMEEIVRSLNAEMGAANDLLEKSEAVIRQLQADKETLTEAKNLIEQEKAKSESEVCEKNRQLEDLRTQLETKPSQQLDQANQISVEQHESELKMLQESAQQTITTLQKKRDAKEAKLKEALSRLSEELDQATIKIAQLEEKLKSQPDTPSQEDQELLSETISKLENQISDLTVTNKQLQTQISEQQQTFQETESQYQTESESLAAAFTKKQKQFKSKNAQLQQSLKELFDEHEALKQSASLDREQFLAEKASLERQLASQLAMNTNLTQSLDLTRVQINDETSKYQQERKFVEDQCQEELKAQEKQLRLVLEKIGVQLDPSHNQVDSFDRLVDKCGILLQNYLEDRRQLSIMLNEREEKARLIEDLEYKLERLQAEKEFMTRQMDESQVQKLKLQVTQMEEERSEMRNDFFIKFNSYSQELSGLKEKIRKYEPSEAESPLKKVDTNEYQLEMSSKDPNQTKSSGGGFTGFVASLFLTESELARRV